MFLADPRYFSLVAGFRGTRIEEESFKLPLIGESQVVGPVLRDVCNKPHKVVVSPATAEQAEFPDPLGEPLEIMSRIKLLVFDPMQGSQHTLNGKPGTVHR